MSPSVATNRVSSTIWTRRNKDKQLSHLVCTTSTVAAFLHMWFESGHSLGDYYALDADRRQGRVDEDIPLHQVDSAMELAAHVRFTEVEW
jgi:hypothetical protein